MPGGQSSGWDWYPILGPALGAFRIAATGPNNACFPCKFGYMLCWIHHMIVIWFSVYIHIFLASEWVMMQSKMSLWPLAKNWKLNAWPDTVRRRQNCWQTKWKSTLQVGLLKYQFYSILNMSLAVPASEVSFTRAAWINARKGPKSQEALRKHIECLGAFQCWQSEWGIENPSGMVKKSGCSVLPGGLSHSELGQDMCKMLEQCSPAIYLPKFRAKARTSCWSEMSEPYCYLWDTNSCSLHLTQRMLV